MVGATAKATDLRAPREGVRDAEREDKRAVVFLPKRKHLSRRFI
jgi:hypothetical protein